MTRSFWWLALGVGLALSLAACRGPARTERTEDQIAALLAHTDRMIGILEEHEGDPDRAARELAAYQEKNGAEIERLKRALGDYMQKDPMKAAAVSAAYGLKSGRLATLAERLAAKTRAR